MNAVLSNQIGIEQLCQLLKIKERSVKDKLKEWGVQIYPLNNPYARNKFVLLEDFTPAYEKYLRGNTPNEPVEDKPQSLTQIKGEMETPTLRQPVTGIFLICKHKKPYKSNEAITCDCKQFKYQAHIYNKGVKNPFKPTLQASNIKDAKAEYEHLKAEYMLVGGRKDLLLKQPNTKQAPAPTPISTPLPLKPQIQMGQTVTPEFLMQLLGQQQQQHQSENLLLIKCIEAYLLELENQKRSKLNNEEAKRFLDKFIDVLIEAGLSVEKMYFTDINMIIAKNIGEKFKVRYGFGKYFDKAVGRLFSFSKYIIEMYELNKANYFTPQKIKRSPTSHKKPIMFPVEEFAPLLKIITKENGWGVFSGQNRNWYKPWLKDAFIMGIFLGGRRESVATIKWSDVIWKNNLPIRLEYENLKVNRHAQIEKVEDKKFEGENITGEFEKYLIQLGLNEKRGSNEFIIAPNETSRKNVIKHCSVGFSHFYSKLNTGKKYQFKQLRKTNFTLKKLEADLAGVEMKNVHANPITTKRHYIDPVAVAYHTKNKTKIRLLE